MGMTAESVSKRGVAHFGDVFEIVQTDPHPTILVVCEHASNHVPETLKGLGLSEEALRSHIAWDPGALGVAQELARLLPTVLIYSTVSRLVYDCNRPPTAESAVPERSEVFRIPGNLNLSRQAREGRIAGVYVPFRDAVSALVAQHRETLELMITVHSFTPIYNGTPRSVHLGILHGEDDRFARAMMQSKLEPDRGAIRLNEPYSSLDGVAHTLDEHGAANGLANVMVEIRNDLIATPQAEIEMARRLSPWITDAIATLRTAGGHA